jgi:hypothetical protein
MSMVCTVAYWVCISYKRGEADVLPFFFCRNARVLTHVRFSVLLHPLPLSPSLPPSPSLLLPPSRCTGHQRPALSDVPSRLAVQEQLKKNKRVGKCCMRVGKCCVFFFLVSHLKVWVLLWHMYRLSHVPLRWTSQEQLCEKARRERARERARATERASERDSERERERFY